MLLSRAGGHVCSHRHGALSQVGIFAVRDLEAGEEVTFDYRMTDGSVGKVRPAHIYLGSRRTYLGSPPSAITAYRSTACIDPCSHGLDPRARPRMSRGVPAPVTAPQSE